MTKQCYHCGDKIQELEVVHNEHSFCCNACVLVYDLLQKSDLETYYSLEKDAGIKPKKANKYQFLFLDEPEIRKKYISYEDNKHLKISLYLPDIHCSSCIYLLENSNKLHQGILQVEVHFTKKEALFSLNPQQIKLSELANLLVQIGYEPNFGNRLEKRGKTNRTFLYKLGVAGFAFGNVMLWSIPEYGGLGYDNTGFRNFSSYLSLIVSIPVLLYSAKDYFISAYKSLKHKQLNLDVPISIGIIALYLQSLWSIINNQGAGYMDSFTGFIFFLLIGKWFQNWTFQSMSFERDYKSYFPVATTKIERNEEKIVEIDNLNEGDQILIRNEEILPCDSILLDENAVFDFSFVTGEADFVQKSKGDFIYAGGKLIGKPALLEVKNKTQRSHLTSLWGADSKQSEINNRKSYQDRVSVYFLSIVIFLSIIAGVYWFFADKTQVTHVVVSILIVTCPCALALSSPFTLGNTMRLLGRKGLYLKNTQIVEKINEITDIVFDKTGTLSVADNQVNVEYIRTLNNSEISAINSLASASLHPVCIGIKNYFSDTFPTEKINLSTFKEVVGNGVEGVLSLAGKEVTIKIGSAKFVNLTDEHLNGSTCITIDDKLVATTKNNSNFRVGLKESISKLKEYNLHVLSGDNTKDEPYLKSVFPQSATFHFHQKPLDKLKYIQSLQENGKNVMMIGDGLNDAGALKQANVGIAVSENSFRFTPASDAIIAADAITKLPKLLQISKNAKLILGICLSFSFLYNIIGLGYAFTGQMSPLVAAILMPISSVTVVLISTFGVMYFGSKNCPKLR